MRYLVQSNRELFEKINSLSIQLSLMKGIVQNNQAIDNHNLFEFRKQSEIIQREINSVTNKIIDYVTKVQIDESVSEAEVSRMIAELPHENENPFESIQAVEIC